MSPVEQSNNDNENVEKKQQITSQVYTDGGAAISGDVNSGGDFVGRDQISNIFIRLSKIPPWLATILVIGIVLITSALIYIVYQFLPPCEMPGKGSFNIAIAELTAMDINGQLVDNSEARERAISIAKFIKEQADTLTEIIKEQVVVWGPEDGVSSIKVGEESLRATAINADLLIYGNLQQLNEEQWQIEPKFYLQDEAINLAQELAGEHALGRKLRYAPSKVAGRGAVNDALRVRTEALSKLIYGLSEMTGYEFESYHRASEIFQDIADNSEWAKLNDNSGQEILYLFLGNAYFAEGSLIDDENTDRNDRLSRSKTAFLKAVELNPTYARSYNGLGSVNFQLARPSGVATDCEWDWPLIDDAERSFQHSLSAPIEEKPDSGQVDTRAHFGLGRIYFWRGYCLDGTQWDLAEDSYDFVLADLDTFSDPPPYLLNLAAYTHTDLGFIALQKSEYYQSIPDAIEQNKAAPLLAEAIGHYKQAFKFIGETQQTAKNMVSPSCPTI